jgi:galactonate dehydratase
MGQPVYRLLGGAMRPRIRTYANGWFSGAKTPDDYARMAAETVAKGFTALKWDPFGHSYMFPSRDQMDEAVECVRAVRQAVGPKIDLCVEVHGRMSVGHAIQIAHELEPFKPTFYEEPVPPENVDAMKQVASSVSIPVATGERLFTKWGFKDLLEKQAATIIQPDPCHDGGILETKKIAAMAETYYVAVAPHNPNGPVATAVCLQLDANLPNFLIQEMNIGDTGWVTKLLRQPIVIKDGYIDVPTAPGLGIEVDEEELQRHTYEPRSMPMYEVT